MADSVCGSHFLLVIFIPFLHLVSLILGASLMPPTPLLGPRIRRRRRADHARRDRCSPHETREVGGRGGRAAAVVAGQGESLRGAEVPGWPPRPLAPRRPSSSPFLLFLHPSSLLWPLSGDFGSIFNHFGPMLPPL